MVSLGYNVLTTVRCCYKAIDFLQSSYKRHPIARPLRMSFVSSNSDLYSASVAAVTYAISCYIVLCYNTNWLDFGDIRPDCSNSSALAIELLQSCDMPEISTSKWQERSQLLNHAMFEIKNTLRPESNSCYFAYRIMKCIFLNES